MTLVASREIVSAHSPDSDDAFMFYGLATKKVRSPKVAFRHVLEDIETLNRKAMEGQKNLRPRWMNISRRSVYRNNVCAGPDRVPANVIPSLSTTRTEAVLGSSISAKTSSYFNVLNA